MNDLNWKIQIQPKASKQLAKLSPKDRVRVSFSIEELAVAHNPTIVPGVKHLKGSNPKQWRQRQGNYRIIFGIEASKFVQLDLEYKGRLIIHSVSLHHTGY